MLLLAMGACKKEKTSGTLKISITCNPGGFHAGYTDPSGVHDPVYVPGTSWETDFKAQRGDEIGFHFTTNNSNATETITVYYHDRQVYHESQTGDSMVSIVTMTVSPLWY